MEDIGHDDVIALVYEAANGQVRWQQALEAVRFSLDCLVVQIVWVDLRRGQFRFSFESEGADVEAAIDYALTYHRIDPHAAYVASGEPGQLIAFSRIFDQTYIDESAFYQDFLIPYGSRHMHGAKLHEADGMAIMLGIHRGVGHQPLEGSDWLAAQRICFHLKRAVQQYSNTRKAAVGGTVARSLLNRLSRPVFLVDAHRQVELRNDAALAQAHASAPLHVDINGALVCTSAEADQKITLALTALSTTSTANDPKPPFVRWVIRIKRAGDEADFLLCLDSIRPEETMGTFGHQPILMVTQYQLGIDLQFNTHLLATAFDLTPAEAMVASAIATGLSYKEIAASRGVTIHTIQTQIKSIYDKLGIHKSTELVVLIHSLGVGSTGQSAIQKLPNCAQA